MQRIIALLLPYMLFFAVGLYALNNGSEGSFVTSDATQQNSEPVTVSNENGKKVYEDVLIPIDSSRAKTGSDKIGCSGESVVLRGSGNGKFTWFDSTGHRISSSQEITVNPSQSTFYILKTEINNRTLFDTVRVRITPVCPPCIISAGQDVVARPGEPVTLSAFTNGNCTRSNCSNKTPPSQNPDLITTILSGSAHYDILANQIAYVPEETVFKGSVNVIGGTLIIAGVASLQKINFNSGNIIITGELTAPELTIGDTLNNYGTISIAKDVSLVAPGCLNNYGTFSVNGTLTLNNRAYNHSRMYTGNDLIQKSNDIFINECSLIVGNDLKINGTFINKGTATVSFNTFIEDGSQYISDDGCNIVTKNMYVESSIQGGSAGMSNITVLENMYIKKNGSVSGRVDICDKTGIEVIAGKISSSVSTDCRTSADGTGGFASFVWYDSMGNIVGTGKTITILPQVSSTYTITVIDVNGNSVSDQVNIKVE